MSSVYDNKAEKFYNNLKKSGFKYVDGFKPAQFEYLFGIQEARPIFDFFLNKLNENTYVTSEDYAEFKACDNKGQVIMDMQRLKELNLLKNLNKEIKTPNAIYSQGFLNDDDEDLLLNIEEEEDLESLRRSVEYLERDIKYCQKKYEYEKYAQKKSLEEIRTQKIKDQSIENQMAKFDEKDTFLRNVRKQMGQNMSKATTELQRNLKEDKFLNQNCIEGDTQTNSYLNKEIFLLENIRKVMLLELDCNDLASVHSKLENFKPNETVLPDETEMNIEKIKNEKLFKLIVEKRYPKTMDRYSLSKISSNISKLLLEEFNKMINQRKVFLEYSAEQLQRDSNLKLVIEERIRKNEAMQLELEEIVRKRTAQIPIETNTLSNLKMVKLAYTDMKIKLLNLLLFSNKQDKLYKLFQSLLTRLESVSYVVNLNLKFLEDFKLILEEMASDFKLLNNHSILSTSLSNTSMLNSMVQPVKSYNQFATSNLLSSTMCFNSSMALGSPSKQLLSKPVEQFNEFNSPYMHILNQFLIAVLSKFESNDGVFKLKHPITINFNENLDNYMSLYQSVRNFYANNKKLNKKEKQVKSYYKVIDRALEYLYEKDEQTTGGLSLKHSSSSSNSLNYNLNKINVKTTKCIEDRVNCLREQAKELHHLFAVRVFQQLSKFKAEIETNKLVKLRRDFFVYFYTNQKQIEFLMQELNSID